MTRVLQLIGRSTSATEVWRTVEELADQLDAQKAPIDYARRRALSYGDLLPESIWIEICQSSGISPGHGLRLSLARCWLYERITGFPGSQAHWAVDSPEFRSKLADLPALMNSELLTAADCYAIQFLARQAITHEPVAWSPAALPHCWPSTAPSHPPPGSRAQVAFSRVLRDSALATASMPPLRSTGIFAARRILPKESLEALYVEQAQSLAHIANRHGLSRQMVTRLARSYGIPIREPRRPHRG